MHRDTARPKRRHESLRQAESEIMLGMIRWEVSNTSLTQATRFPLFQRLHQKCHGEESTRSRAQFRYHYERLLKAAKREQVESETVSPPLLMQV